MSEMMSEVAVRRSFRTWIRRSPKLPPKWSKKLHYQANSVVGQYQDVNAVQYYTKMLRSAVIWYFYERIVICRLVWPWTVENKRLFKEECLHYAENSKELQISKIWVDTCKVSETPVRCNRIVACQLIGVSRLKGSPSNSYRNCHLVLCL